MSPVFHASQSFAPLISHTPYMPPHAGYTPLNMEQEHYYATPPQTPPPAYTFIAVNNFGDNPTSQAPLPPMQLVERQQVTTVATQAASNRRRTAPARFTCPVANCNATFTRRFNLRGHLRSHAEQRPFVCTWAGCGKSFARAHDRKRHETLHCSKAPFLLCDGCSKPFSRSDSLRRHWRSEGGQKCRERGDALMAEEDAADALLQGMGFP